MLELADNGTYYADQQLHFSLFTAGCATTLPLIRAARTG